MELTMASCQRLPLVLGGSLSDGTELGAISPQIAREGNCRGPTNRSEFIWSAGILAHH
jgi:hypothetical protein